MLASEEKRLVDTAADALYYVSKDENGILYIDLYADYSDTNEGLLQPAYDSYCKMKELPNTQTTVSDALCAKISDYYDQTIWQMEDDIIRKAGFDPSSEKAGEIRQYLWEAYSFRVPYDHYLDQNMRINLMLGTPEELNLDFGAIRETREALTGQLDTADIDTVLQENTVLHWLVSQQGYTMQDLRKTMDDYIQFFYGNSNNSGLSDEARLSIFHKTHSFFLSSVCEELENTTNFMNTITVLAEVSMRDFCSLIQADKELVLPKDIILGVFNPWLGGGSTLDIRLEKDLVLPSSMIWHVQVEGTQMESQYSVDSVYGLSGGAWKKGLTVRDADAFQKDKPRLDTTIKSADERRTDINITREKSGTEPEL